MLNKLGRSFTVKYYLSRYQWYRKWYGGRWEHHYIDICASHMWLDMYKNRCWPQWRQPCSVGEPIIEDYPEKTGLAK